MLVELIEKEVKFITKRRVRWRSMVDALCYPKWRRGLRKRRRKQKKPDKNVDEEETE